jgi:HEAT repeat protein
VNSRTITVIVVVLVVFVAIYGITAYQRGVKTKENLEALTSDDTAAVVKAIDGLASGGPEVVSSIQPLVNHSNPEIKSRAAILMGLCGTPANASIVRQALLDDPDPYVRRDAVVALGNMRAVDATADLTGILGDVDEDMIVRAAAARALARLDFAGAAKPLVKALADHPAPPPPVADDEEPVEFEDPTAQLRAAAAEALACLASGDDEAVAALGDAIAEDPDDAVRQAAATALGFVVHDNSDSTEVENAIDALLAGLEDENGDVRTACVIALGRATTIEGTSKLHDVHRALDKAANDPHYWVREAAEAARDSLPPYAGAA